MASADPVLLRERRVRALWRFAFILYALALTIGTHWPRLQLGLGGVPAPDKIIHFTAFGGLAFLLWMTGWIGRVSILLAVAIVWAFLDELTQAIPVLRRSFSWWDIIAGWLGIMTVALWIWASAPVGGRINRMRIALYRFVFQELFAHPRTWILTGFSGGLMASVIGSCTGFLVWWFDPTEPRIALKAGLAGTIAGGLAGVYAMFDALARRAREPLVARQPCFECGASVEDARVNDRGWGSCPGCGSQFHLGQWFLSADLPRVAVIGQVWRAGSFALSLGLLAAVSYAVLLNMPHLLTAILRGRTIPDDLHVTMYYFIILAIQAIATRTFRKRIARIIDRQGEQCRMCGHNVHATPVERGIGRCGECGMMFVRA